MVTATCGGASSVSAATSSAKTTYVSIGTAGSGGYFYPMGAAIANIINRFVPGVEASSEITGGSVENATLVGDGEVEMGMAHSHNAYAAYHGLDPYTKPYPDIRSMFAIQPSVFQLVTMQDSGITTIPDLKNKRVIVGPAGGGQVLLFAEILSAYGMSLDDMEPVYISFTDGIAELLDGNCDAVVAMSATPTAAMVELAARSDKWVFVDFDPEILAKFVASSSYFVHFSVEGGFYSGMRATNYDTVAVSCVMMANIKVPDDVVYAICEAVYDHLDILANTVDSAKNMELETGSTHPIDLHPGAERFFKDKGVLK